MSDKNNEIIPQPKESMDIIRDMPSSEELEIFRSSVIFSRIESIRDDIDERKEKIGENITPEELGEVTQSAMAFYQKNNPDFGEYPEVFLPFGYKIPGAKIKNIYMQGMPQAMATFILKEVLIEGRSFNRLSEREIKGLSVAQKIGIKGAQEAFDKIFDGELLAMAKLSIEEFVRFDKLKLLMRQATKLEQEKYLKDMVEIVSAAITRHYLPKKFVIEKPQSKKKIKEQKIPKTSVADVTEDKKVDVGPNETGDKKKPFSKVESIKDFFGL